MSSMRGLVCIGSIWLSSLGLAFAQSDEPFGERPPILIYQTESPADPRGFEQYREAGQVAGVPGVVDDEAGLRLRLFAVHADHAQYILGLPDAAAVRARYDLREGIFSAVLIAPDDQVLARSDAPLTAAVIAPLVARDAMARACGTESTTAAAMVVVARRYRSCARTAADFFAIHRPGSESPFISILFANLFAISDCALPEENSSFLIGFMAPPIVGEVRDRYGLDELDRRAALAEAMRDLALDQAALRSTVFQSCTLLETTPNEDAPRQIREFISLYADDLADPGSVGIHTVWATDWGIGAEFRRRLLVGRGEEQQAFWLSLDTGGADSVQLFTTSDGSLAFLDAFGDGGVIAAGSSSVARAENIGGWRFLGVFEILEHVDSKTGERVGRDLTFVPAAVRPECGANTITEDRPWPRLEANRPCPTVHYDVAQHRFVPVQ